MLTDPRVSPACLSCATSGTQNVSNKRLANIQSVLRAALQDALNDELIELNPMHGWKYARKDAP